MKNEIHAVATATASLHVSGIMLATLVTKGLLTFTEAVEMVDGVAALAPDIAGGSAPAEDRQAFLQAYLSQIDSVYSLLEAVRPGPAG